MTQIKNILAMVSFVLVLSLNAAPLWSAPETPAAEEVAVEDPAAHTVTADEADAHETTGYSAERWRDFLYRVINFVVYVAILYFLLRKPIKNFLSGRRDNVARTLEYLETQSRNLSEQTGALTRQLDQLGQERLGILSQYERDGAKERDRIIAEAHRTAELIIKRAESAMDLEIKTARQKLTAEIGELAKNLAQEEIVEKITDDDRSRLVLEFVDKVVKLPARRN
ncbi:MAG: ATP synthase F0 subunit B [Deltaproteobacteria bacterium]|nr:ATP synthase F0 subunit B [Deltaproteobacteria bacterium]